MSLGSKELYHSNVWAWLISKDESFISAFFDSIPEGFTFERVDREKKNRDLSIWFKNSKGESKCLVVENKLKSIPAIEQLEKYTNDLGDRFQCGVLTGLKKPNILDEDGCVSIGEHRWIFKSYKDISNKMLELLSESKNEVIRDNESIISEYLNNNKLVEEIVDANIVDKSLKQIEDNRLDLLGLQDLTNKVIASSFLGYVKKKMREVYPAFEGIQFGESFHNKKTTLYLRIAFNDERGSGYSVGVQIEGDQYRRILTFKENKNGVDELFNKGEQMNYFATDYDPKEKMISFPGDTKKRRTKMSKKFDKYGDITVYQYSSLTDEELDFDSLFERIVEDLKICAANIR